MCSCVGKKQTTAPSQFSTYQQQSTLQFVSMTNLLPTFASFGDGWRGEVGPVVSVGASLAAVQNDVALNLFLPGGVQGLTYKLTNVTVWCGKDDKQSAQARSNAHDAFVEQGPSEPQSANRLPNGSDISTVSGRPDFTFSPVQAGSSRSGGLSQAESDGDDTQQVVVGSAGAGCIGMY